MTNVERRGPSTKELLGLALGLTGTAAGITMMFLAMRAVMGVGGSCADGGPYVIATPCPEGAPAGMLIGLFAMLVSWAVASVLGSRVGGVWSTAPILGWAGLFVALGWNFLEAGFGGDGVDFTGVLLGVMFWAMGLVPLVVALAAVRGSAKAAKSTARAAGPQPETRGGFMAYGSGSDAAHGSGGEGVHADRRFAPSVAATDGSAVRKQLLAAIAADLGTAAARSAPGESAEPGGDTEDLVAHLERLADLRSKGLLDEAEYAAAKAAILKALEGVK